APVITELVLAADHAVAVRQKLGRHGRAEDHVVRIVSQQRVEVMGIPGALPFGGESGGFRLIHATTLAARTGSEPAPRHGTPRTHGAGHPPRDSRGRRASTPARRWSCPRRTGPRSRSRSRRRPRPSGPRTGSARPAR